jgi:hypothetical protein
MLKIARCRAGRYSACSPLRGSSGRSHKETWAGCIVFLTIPTRSITVTESECFSLFRYLARITADTDESAMNLNYALPPDPRIHFPRHALIVPPVRVIQDHGYGVRRTTCYRIGCMEHFSSTIHRGFIVMCKSETSLLPSHSEGGAYVMDQAKEQPNEWTEKTIMLLRTRGRWSLRPR